MALFLLKKCPQDTSQGFLGEFILRSPRPKGVGSEIEGLKMTFFWEETSYNMSFRGAEGAKSPVPSGAKRPKRREIPETTRLVHSLPAPRISAKEHKLSYGSPRYDGGNKAPRIKTRRHNIYIGKQQTMTSLSTTSTRFKKT